ncbi:MAG: zinc ribbon domain-containing protein [Chloroflexi bacterium]|nr:zinc ribbon domain-containing protein [Chloroflexota bacterium]
MPIYQYDCAGCGRRVDILFRSVSKAAKPCCPECGSAKLKRAVSQVARLRSERERVESIDFDQEMGHLQSGDESGFARWARRMGRQYDGELGSEFSQIADKADAGEDPIERVDPAHTLRWRIQKRREELSGPASGGDAGDAGGP